MTACSERFSRAEVERLVVHDRIFTRMLGAVLPEHPRTDELHDVLDIGSGSGGWLLGVAGCFPGIASLCGVDVNVAMVNFARELARTQQLQDRVAFRQMDALHPLQFGDSSFDLVHQRFATSWIRSDCAMCRRSNIPLSIVLAPQKDSISPMIGRAFFKILSPFCENIRACRIHILHFIRECWPICNALALVRFPAP
jgi:SAM-dependent methyltransferase